MFRPSHNDATLVVDYDWEHLEGSREQIDLEKRQSRLREKTKDSRTLTFFGRR